MICSRLPKYSSILFQLFLIRRTKAEGTFVGKGLTSVLGAEPLCSFVEGLNSARRDLSSLQVVLLGLDSA